MKETLYWHNQQTGITSTEIREQVSPGVWRSLTDGRYYTKGILGWWDITDRINNYLALPPR